MAKATFIIGNTYIAQSAVNSNTTFPFKVIKRTAKTIWLQEQDKTPIRRKIVTAEGIEIVLASFPIKTPYGSIFVLSANRLA